MTNALVLRSSGELVGAVRGLWGMKWTRQYPATLYDAAFAQLCLDSNGNAPHEGDDPSDFLCVANSLSLGVPGCPCNAFVQPGVTAEGTVR